MSANRFNFRAWSVAAKKMIDPGVISSTHIYELAITSNVSGWIWMQSTGLVDKNGAEIFDGDILCYDGKNIVIKPPEWQVIDAFMVHCRPGLDSFRDDYKREDEPSRQIREGQVIGNIYENPELIK
jgi:hypothetical protein